MCQLLLGDTAAAADTLGLGPGSDIKCDRTMLAFIKVSAACAVGEARGMCLPTACVHCQCSSALRVAPTSALASGSSKFSARSGVGIC